MDRSDARLNPEAIERGDPESLGENAPLLRAPRASRQKRSKRSPCLPQGFPRGFACWLLTFAAIVFVVLVLLYTATLPKENAISPPPSVTPDSGDQDDQSHEALASKFRVAFYVLIVAYGVILVVWLMAECFWHRKKLAQMKTKESATPRVDRDVDDHQSNGGDSGYQDAV